MVSAGYSRVSHFLITRKIFYYMTRLLFNDLSPLFLGRVHVDSKSLEYGHDLAQGRVAVPSIVSPAGFDPGR